MTHHLFSFTPQLSLKQDYGSPCPFFGKRLVSAFRVRYTLTHRLQETKVSVTFHIPGILV